MTNPRRQRPQDEVPGAPLVQKTHHLKLSDHRVAIYVLPGCGNCAYAWEIAALIQREYPRVEVAVVDLASPTEPVPDAVFATPTYLLDGRLWSLGNPSPAQVRERLDQLEA